MLIMYLNMNVGVHETLIRVSKCRWWGVWRGSGEVGGKKERMVWCKSLVSDFRKVCDTY